MAQNVPAEVLKRIQPKKTEQQQLQRAVASFLKKLNPNLKAAKAQAILGGSGAKDTWLSGSYDLDLFVLFDYQEYAKKSLLLSSILEPLLKKSFPKVKIARVHGSRDYFQVPYQKINFEVIPILKIKQASDAINITDISPLHSIWVNAHTKKLKEEIRLAKQFCKANALYGAESYLSGFSGYVLEILIGYYGSLEKLFQASQLWEIKTVIDPEKYYLNQEAALFNLNQSKLQSPLIVIDPVDKNRNASAALSLEKFMKFKQLAREYLKHPEVKFFVKEELDFSPLKKEAEKAKQNLFFLSTVPLPGKEDVSGSRLLQVFRFLEEKLAPFSVKKSGWDWDQKNDPAKFYFFLAKRELPKQEVRKGPPLALKEFVKAFKKANKETYEADGRVWTKVAMPYPRLEDFAKNLLKEKYILERVEKIKAVGFN